MLPKKRTEKARFSALLETSLTEILVTNGRSFEPFVKIFHAESENVTKSGLGTLLGVFEISERSEDSAYIVNFLSSVARKEYFANSRRGAIEGFEAALHKVNIALAELVKHGNVEWLGKLHGALAVVEKNNLHFSVTGEARILLLRNTSVADISAGLASEESVLHPMKTFVEVASGQLQADDNVILASPEIFRLFTLAELEKNALRLAERFPQFLKTAMVNELDMAGLIFLSLREGLEKFPVAPAPVAKKEGDAMPDLNVFSEQTFLPPTRSEPESPSAESVQSEEKNEYIDQKTGHIYIQGDVPRDSDASPAWEKVGLQVEEAEHTFRVFWGTARRFLRKSRKQGLIFLDRSQEASLVFARRAWRSLRRTLRKIPIRNFSLPTLPRYEPPQNAEAESKDPVIIEPAPPDLPESRVVIREEAQIADAATPLEAWFRGEKKEKLEKASAALASKRVAVQTFLLRMVRKSLVFLRSFGQRLAVFGYVFGRKFIERFQRLTKRQKLLIAGGFCVGLLFLFSLGRLFPEDAPPAFEGSAEDPEAANTIPSSEKNAQALGAPAVLLSREEKLAQPVLLGDRLFTITASGTFEQATQAFYPLPTGSGAALEAAPMEDLELIFVYTDTGALFAFSPLTRSYVSSTLSLPPGAQVRDLGAYLTYLYVLDSSTDQIYRFPRAEGGFGPPLSWLRNSSGIEDQARMAINETIFLSRDGVMIEGYFRGERQVTLEAPTAPLQIQALYSKPGLGRVYALDQKNRRLLVWNLDGSLASQRFSDRLAVAESLAVDEKTGQVYVTAGRELLAFPLANNP